MPVKNGEGAFVADEATLDELERSGRVVVRYTDGAPNGSARDIAGICNAEGNVFGLMPHPEHAIDPLTGPSADGLGFFTSVVARTTREHERERQRTPSRSRRGRPEVQQPYKELGLTDDEYQKIRDILGRRPTAAELALYSVMWSEHCSYKSSKVHLRNLAPTPTQSAAPARGHRRERRRGGHRAGLRGHLQDREPQPPVVRRAPPGRGDRHRRHRARHPGDGRPAGRGDGRAAVRPGRRARHRPGAARRRVRHLVLRQLPRPAEHRRRARLRPLLRGEPAGQRAVRGADAARRPQVRRRDRRGQQGGAVRLADRPGRRGRRVGAGQRDVRGRRGKSAKRPSVQVGDPFMEKLLVECCLELYAAGPDRGHPGPGRGRGRLRDDRAGRGR